MKTYILFNPHAGSNNGEKNAHKLDIILKNENLVYINITRTDAREFLKGVCAEDKIILCGGDGTLNRFINDIDTVSFKNDIYVYPAGSGNDFLIDLNIRKPKVPVKINDYIKNLPVITVNGKEYKFINGAGLGIDGYACSESGRIRREKSKSVSYVSIAVKGILKTFSPFNSTITIDGKIYEYTNLWLAPSMKGRYCGSGLMFTPEQSRTSGKITFMAVHDVSRLRLLTILPKVFKGNHIKHRKYVECIEGKHIIVEPEIPCPMQIDGEVIDNVSKYEIISEYALKKEL